MILIVLNVPAPFYCPDNYDNGGYDPTDDGGYEDPCPSGDYCECYGIGCDTNGGSQDTVEDNELPPCFGVTSETDTSNILDTESIKNALNNAGLANYSSSIIEVFREKGLISSADLSSGSKNILNAKRSLGNGIGILSIGVSAVDYLEEPTTQNLLRFVFDALTSNPATGATLGLGVSLIELFKNNNGESIIDKALKAAGNKIDELSDCDLGAGIHGLIF